MDLKELLRPVAGLPGVRGAALLSADGVLIASEFEGVDGEALAALASQLVRQADEASGPVGCSAFRRLTLRALHGNLYFARFDELVVLVAGRSDLEAGNLWDEVERVAGGLPRFSQADVNGISRTGV